ncbi:MAG: hypothetical protein KF865_02490 [Bdellovibrionaceae bacterium]|nr:hypothetical protein [Pseudobdellovibrionaceae bacterium]
MHCPSGGLVAPHLKLTAENHLNYRFIGTDEDPVPHGDFVVRMGRCARRPGTAMEEAVRAARLIAASTQEEIWLCMSGGIDSEAMAEAFLEAGEKFSVAILRFAGGFNEFDIHQARDFCRRRNLTCREFEIDLKEFYASGRHLRDARDHGCRSPQLSTHLYLMETVPGFPVFSWNVPNVERFRKPWEARHRAVIHLPTELFFCYHRFLVWKNKPGVPFFFAYTPELIYSFLRTPALQEMIFSEAPDFRPEYLDYRMKCRVYREGGFSAAPRSAKMTGFEEVRRHYARTTDLGEGAFNLLYRKPMEELAPAPSRERYLVWEDHLRV